jgi:hypothetical protein
MQNEAAVDYFKVLAQDLLGETKINTKIFAEKLSLGTENKLFLVLFNDTSSIILTI